MRRFSILFAMFIGCGGSSSKSAEAPTPPVEDPAPVASTQPEQKPAPEPFRPTVHAWAADGNGIFANSYLVETAAGVVVVDGALRVSDGKAIAAKAAELGKPVLAVLVTHGHPDHYNGITEILGTTTAPVIASVGVDKVIREHDAAKEKQWKGMFKDEWPSKRTFPTKTVTDGETVTFGDVAFTVHDLGAGESHHDSYWTATIGGDKVAFIGDAVLSGMHAYTTDGHTTEWLANLEKLRTSLADATRLYPGHGDAGGLEILDWQKSYLETYRAAVKKHAKGKAKLSDAAKQQLVAEMKAHAKTDKGEFLIGLGADPVAAELAKKK